MLHEDVTAGVITDRDIVVRVVAECADPDQTTTGAIVSIRNPRTNDPLEVINTGVAMLPGDTSVAEAVRYMDQRQIRRVLVHDQHFRAIGVVSRVDLPEASAVPHG